MMRELHILRTTLTDTNYVLEIRVKNKSANYYGFLQKEKLEELSENIKVLQNSEQYELIIKEDG